MSPGSFAGAEAHTISLYSLSKTYGMAGWRIGYMAYPERLAAAMAKVQDTILICPTVISQVAAAAAMEVGPALLPPARRGARGGSRRRDGGARGRSSRSARCRAAEGAFYCCLRVNVTADPMRVAERLIREHQGRRDSRDRRSA